MRIRRYTAIAFWLSLLLAISSCGNKGPLYLPDEAEEEKREASEY